MAGNGIFEPFSDAEAEGPIAVAGVLDATEVTPGETPIPLRSSPDPDTSKEAAGGGVVPPGNRAPSAANVALAAAEDGEPVDAAFSATDPDPADQGKLAFEVLTQPAQGALKDNLDGTFTYDPGEGFQALAEGETSTQSFTYQANDPQGTASNVATVTITVTGVNDAPTATDKTFATTEDGPVVAGTLAGDDIDSDDDPDTLSFVLSALNGKGALKDNGDGTFSFDPGTAFDSLTDVDQEIVTFTYQAKDSHGALSAPATVTITVTGTNDAPTAVDKQFAASEDGPAIDGTLSGDDVDDDDDPTTLSFVFSDLNGKGTLIDKGDGTFSYDPGTAFDSLSEGDSEDVTFTYQTKDSHDALSAPATVTITVAGVNDAPTAAPTAASLTEDDFSVGGSFLGDDPDSDDDPASLTYAITTPPPTGQGTVVNNDDGTFDFIPGEDFNHLAVGEKAQVTFKYTATDSHGAVSPEAEVTVTVTGVNDLPIPTTLVAQTTEDGPPISAFPIADDPDSDDDPGTLVYKLAIPLPPDQGKIIDDGGGKFTFDPDGDFEYLSEGETQELAFAYTVTDSHDATSDISIATVTVIGVNDAPTAKSLEFSTAEDGPDLLEALTGDDIDNDDDSKTLTYILGPLSGKGALIDNLDGTFTFNPGTDFQSLKAGESETVSFTYQTKDSHDAVSGLATVTITVTGIDDAPVANPVAIAAKEDGGEVTESYDATDADDDPSNSQIRHRRTTSGRHGHRQQERHIHLQSGNEVPIPRRRRAPRAYLHLPGDRSFRKRLERRDRHHHGHGNQRSAGRRSDHHVGRAGRR